METVKAVLITGETYTSRRELKALGGKWNPEESGWLVPIAQQDAARKLAAEKGFDVEEREVDSLLLTRPEGERLRAIRQAKLDKKIDTWNARADRLDAKAAENRKAIEPYNDFAFWTEPIKIGHHSEGRHRRLRERLQNKLQKSFELAGEAEELRKNAEWAERSGVRIAGDAERRRQAEREELDKVIKVGSKVVDFGFGPGTVIRVNKKTYTIKYDSGSTYAREKTFIRPVGEAA